MVRPRVADFLNNWESRGREMTEVREASSLDRTASVGSLLSRDNEGVQDYPKAVGWDGVCAEAPRRIAPRSCDGEC